MKYSHWEEVKVEPLMVELDKENYRIQTDDDNDYDNEIDIISVMFEREKLSELVEGIARDGFNKAEPIVLVKEKNRYLVVEGNRRLSALKVLLNDEIRARFKQSYKIPALKKADKALLEKVPAIVARSKDDALQYIVERHMGSGLKRWTVEQSRTIVSDLYERGLNPDEISEIVNKSGGDARKALRQISTIRFFKELAFQQKIEPKDITRATYPLLYFFERKSKELGKSPRALLGINFNDKHELIIEDPSETKSYLEKLAIGFLKLQTNKKTLYATRTEVD